MKTSEFVANTSAAQFYEFGEFALDPMRRKLSRRDGAPVPLTPRVFDTLLYLVEHSSGVLDKERIMEAVWPDSIVEENNLTQNISALRRILGESPGSHRFIVTVPGRGYRFVAEVSAADKAVLPGASPETSIVPEPAERPSKAISSLLPEVKVAQPVEPERPRAEGSRDRSERPARGRAGSMIAAAISVLLLGAAVLFFWRSPTPPAAAIVPAAALPAKSIAVLPFENLSADPQNAYFATGIQDEILSNLAKIADLKVISRTSAGLYKIGNPRNLREIGEQLGVAHVLEGNVQRSGDHMRINAQLIDTRTDGHLWAQTYDRDVADVFAVQSEIARTIATQLQAKISPAEGAAITRPPTSDLAANALYAQAIALDSYDRDTLLEGVRLLDEAVTRDPAFVAAYCKLSRIHLDLYFGGLDHTSARLDLANAAIEKAEQIRPDDGNVHLARAQYWLHGFRDYDRARAELEIARRTLPNDASVYRWCAVLDRRQGRWSEAIRNIDRAVELDPQNVDHLLTAAELHRRMRNYAEADRLLNRALAVAPRDKYVRLNHASQSLERYGDAGPLRRELDAMLGENPAAAIDLSDTLFYCALVERDASAVKRALALIPPQGAGGGNFPWPREWFVALAARASNETETARASFGAARIIVEKIVQEQPDYPEALSLLGRIDAGLGRKEDAIRESRHACELLPLSKDATYGVWPIRALAWTYAWCGEKELACDQLEIVTREGGIEYGELKLNPEWDSLRGYPRFEKIVASLAPEAKDLGRR